MKKSISIAIAGAAICLSLVLLFCFLIGWTGWPGVKIPATQPTASTIATNSTEPDSTDPTNPTTPTSPTGPTTNPTDPTEPTKPVDPARPSVPPEHICFYEIVEETHIPATCYSSGSATYRCACGAEFASYLGIINHDYRITEEVLPSGSIDGHRILTCCMCDDTYTVPIPVETGTTANPP